MVSFVKYIWNSAYATFILYLVFDECTELPNTKVLISAILISILFAMLMDNLNDIKETLKELKNKK